VADRRLGLSHPAPGNYRLLAFGGVRDANTP